MMPGDNDINHGNDGDQQHEGGFAAGNLAVATPKRSVSTQAVVLGVVLVVSAGALFGMRHFGLGPAGAIASSVKIDYKMDDDGPNVPEGYADVLDALDRSSKPLQVDANLLEQDPFVLNDLMPVEIDLDADDVADYGEAAARLIREREAQRRRDVQADINRMTLQSVLGGRVPVARIGSSIVRVGDPLGEFFIVQAIEGRTVVLATEEGWIFELSMEENELGDQMSVTRQRETPKR